MSSDVSGEGQRDHCPGILAGPGQAVTKQYNLVSANERWHSAGTNVTVGPASNWPRVTDNNGLSTADDRERDSYIP